MRTRVIAALLVSLLLNMGTASAQEWPSHQQTAATISNWLVAGQVGAEVTRTILADNTTHELGCFAARFGATMGMTELLKRTVKRERPDGTDFLSFPSGHTAALVAASGWKVQFGIPIAIGGGYLRVAAHKHYISDTVGGALVALLARRICR